MALRPSRQRWGAAPNGLTCLLWRGNDLYDANRGCFKLSFLVQKRISGNQDDKIKNIRKAEQKTRQRIAQMKNDISLMLNDKNT